MRYILAFVIAGAACAQVTEDRMHPIVASVRYPALAEAARIQGDVRVRLHSGTVTPVSGHPILARAADESAKGLASIHAETDIDVIYHFVLVETTRSVPTAITVKRGNAVERAFLRMFGFKTCKVVVENRCQEGDAPANEVRIAGATVEIWIYGRSRCLQTESTTLIATR